MIQPFYFWIFNPEKIKTLTWKDICTLMFTAALFIVAKIQRQPKCSSVNEQIKKMQHRHTHTHTRILFSVKKKKKKKTRMKSCDNMNGPWGHYAKWKSQTKTNTIQISKEKRKDIPIWMQSSREYQGDIKKPSSVISAKK